MNINVSFEFAKVYGIHRIDAVKGQKFSLFTDSGIPLRWFSDQDKVLSLDESETSVAIVATEIGTSTILITDQAKNKVDEVLINVVDAIVEPAKTLGPEKDGVAVNK